MVLLEIVSPRDFGTTDLAERSVVTKGTSLIGGTRTVETGDVFTVSHAEPDGNDFKEIEDGGGGFVCAFAICATLAPGGSLSACGLTVFLDCLLCADRDLLISRATNQRCSAHVFKPLTTSKAPATRTPAPFRFFLQLSGESVMIIDGEQITLKRGSACTVGSGKVVIVEMCTGECFEMWEARSGERARL